MHETVKLFARKHCIRLFLLLFSATSMASDHSAPWDSSGYQPLTGIGAQLQIEFKLGYNYPLPISLGYAYGTDDTLGKNYLYLNFGSNY